MRHAWKLKLGFSTDDSLMINAQEQVRLRATMGNKQGKERQSQDGGPQQGSNKGKSKDPTPKGSGTALSSLGHGQSGKQDSFEDPSKALRNKLAQDIDGQVERSSASSVSRWCMIRIRIVLMLGP